MRKDDITVGRYTGRIVEEYRESAFLSWLEDIGPLVRKAAAEKTLNSRNLNVVLQSRGSPTRQLAVKRFGRQLFLKDQIDRKRGTKARRTWLAATFLHEKGVGTPPPIGFLELWGTNALDESYFLSEFQANATSFAAELIRLFRDDPDCDKFMHLMQTVAAAIRRMHDTGFRHNDLGNQNILLRKEEPSAPDDVLFIDLNRSEIKSSLTLKDRARDISRIYLPSDLLRVFKEMYWGDMPPPEEFQRWERLYRRRYAVHSFTRAIRHPVRTLRHRQTEQMKVIYPSEKDMWIWDNKSAQPISVMRPRDRRRFFKSSNVLKIARSTLGGILQVRKEYHSLLQLCYRQPVAMSNRIGVAISPTPETLDREIALLEDIGKVPVIIRFCQHEQERHRKFLAGVVRDLSKQGHATAVALIQNRRCVLDPALWDAFAAETLEQVAGHVENVEIGHAINRVKWGIWDLEEHRRLIEGVAQLSGKYPRLSFTGPAVIDFEYPFLMAALRNIPESFRFAALSHHLYVDRRGAPENPHGAFTALDKFALARAVARWSGICNDKLIVSEVNWPIKGTGAHSPVTSPYESPGPRFNDPSVSEKEYGDYMIRYLLIALCSGMVERVYWWRLVARGFGLVDDTDGRTWRKRPAFDMLRYLVATVGDASFREKPSSPPGSHVFTFDLADGRKAGIAYCVGGEQQIAAPFEYSRATRADGTQLSSTGTTIHVSGTPVYVFSK
jgi:hypothetical protein